MSKLYYVAAKAATLASLFFASGFWDTVKKIFIWLFDESCDPDKFGFFM